MLVSVWRRVVIAKSKGQRNSIIDLCHEDLREADFRCWQVGFQGFHVGFQPLGLRRKERSERGEGRGFGARRQVRPRPATSVSFTRRSHPP
jgi:hypothetical protein